MRVFFGLVGLGMFLGFGALWVDLLLDLRAYPETPRPITVHEAVSMEEPPRGSWVELSDVRFPCDQAIAHAGSSVYRLGFGATADDRIIVAGDRPCSDAPTKVVGVLNTASPGRIVDLTFPGFPFESWPRAWQTTLWVESGPEDARYGVFFLPPFAFLGLLVLAFFWRPEPAPFTPLETLAIELPEVESPEPILPAVGLRLESQWYGRAVTLGFLVSATWLFGALAFTSVTVVESWWARVPLLVFFVGLAGFVAFAGVRTVIGWSKERALAPMRECALAQVEAYEDRGAGNLLLRWRHPVTGELRELSVGGHEEAPLVFEGFCLVVWSEPSSPTVVRERFVPFALKPAEQRAAARRFIQHVRRATR